MPHYYSYLDEMGHTSHNPWKGIISTILQNHHPATQLSRKSETMFTPSSILQSRLKLTENIAEFGEIFFGILIHTNMQTNIHPYIVYSSQKGGFWE